MTRRIVGIGGTVRQGSSSELLVRAVLGECEALGAATAMFDGPSLAALPMYNPEGQDRNDAERALVDAVRSADGLVIGSPGYHGSVSGVVKNAIDLLEDTRSDERCYFDGLPIGLVVSAAGWQAGGVTLAAMRGIVHAMRGWPTPLGIMINSSAQRPFAADGRIADTSVAEAVALQARQIMTFKVAA